MKLLTITMLALLLTACATQAHAPTPKTVVILGNKTQAVVCDDTEAAIQRARADRWKAYAEKLEAELGITPKENIP